MLSLSLPECIILLICPYYSLLDCNGEIELLFYNFDTTKVFVFVILWLVWCMSMYFTSYFLKMQCPKNVWKYWVNVFSFNPYKIWSHDRACSNDYLVYDGVTKIPKNNGIASGWQWTLMCRATTSSPWQLLICMSSVCSPGYGSHINFLTRTANLATSGRTSV